MGGEIAWPLFTTDIELAKTWLLGRLTSDHGNKQALHWCLNLGLEEFVEYWAEKHKKDIGEDEYRKIMFRVARIREDEDPYLALVNGDTLRLEHSATLSDGDRVTLVAGEDGARLLLLAGKPIGEPVAQYGPFVMNTQEEIEQALRDYRAGTLAEPA